MALRQTTRFAENVAFLSLLTETPSPPSSNPTPTAANNTGPVRILSFERERSLAEGLAFLCGISSNPNHVIALCLEEKPGKDGISVVLAINKARPAEEEKMLATIKQGLQDIFDLLGAVRYDSDRYKIEWDLIRTVVRFARTRILQRIGSNRVKYGQKRPAHLGSTLRTVTIAVAGRLQQGLLEKSDRVDAEIFIRHSRALQLLLEELEVCPAPDVDAKLERIIHTANRLGKTATLPGFLRNMTNRELDRNTSDGLLRRAGKIARYYSFSRRLFQTAKNTKLFRCAEVTTVSLPLSCFSSVQSPTSNCTLDACVGRCSLPKGAKAQLLQNLDLTVDDATDEIRTIATKTVNEAKIHAELQIIAHFKLNPAKLPPRVIASNKDACYLCNEAIRLEGTYHVPRSHGRLYPGWRLPAMDVFNPLYKKLNEALGRRISEVCRQVSASDGKLIFSYPNESTIFAFSTSMSTIPSLTDLQLRLQPPVTVLKPPCDKTTASGPSTVDENLLSASPREDAVAVEPTTTRVQNERTDSGYASMTTPDEDHEPLPTVTRTCLPGLSDVPPRCSATNLGSEQNNGPADIANDVSSSTPNDESSAARTLGAEGASSFTTSNQTSSASLRKTEEGPESATSLLPSQTPLPTNEAMPCNNKYGIDAETQTYNATPLASEQAAAPGRSSVMTLKKGVGIQCRLTEYTSFRAAQLSIIPESVRKDKVSRQRSDCRVRIEWLEDEPTSATVTDAVLLSAVTETDTPDCFHLRHEGVVVRVDITRC